MKAYRVFCGPATLGVGDVVGLTAAQVSSRKHNLQVMQTDAQSGIVTARASALLQFKVGEEIFLPDLPKHLVNVLQPLATPESATDKRAAAVVAKAPPETKQRAARSATRIKKKVAARAAAKA